MARPYSISLLNELHEHFPDLLYQPSRFRNVSDVLNYIISVARQNPYDTHLSEYERNRRTSDTQPSAGSVAPQNSSRVSHTIPAILPTFLDSRQQPSDHYFSNLYGVPSLSTTRNSLRNTGISTSSRLNSNLSSATSSDPIMSFLGELLVGSTVANPAFNVSLTNFLDDRVPVRPTEEQIQSATVLTTINPQPNETCAICQDTMEDGQSVRIISHCIHRFHQECIDTWFQSHVTCPTCRHDIRESSAE